MLFIYKHFYNRNDVSAWDANVKESKKTQVLFWCRSARVGTGERNGRGGRPQSVTIGFRRHTAPLPNRLGHSFVRVGMMQMRRFAISLFDFVKVYTIDEETRPTDPCERDFYVIVTSRGLAHSPRLKRMRSV